MLSINKHNNIVFEKEKNIENYNKLINDMNKKNILIKKLKKKKSRI